MQVQEINISQKFWPCLTTEKRYTHSYGGRGSSKSHHEAINFILKIIQPTFFRGVLVREVQDTIRASQYRVIKDLITLYGLSDLVTCNESRMEFYCASTGNTIISQGLKKSSKNETAKFKSITDPTHVWIEEAEEISEEDFEKIDGSVRKAGIKCQIRLTYNTGIEPDHWIRLKFHKREREDTFYLHSTYLDNLDNLNEEYVKTRQQMAIDEPERYAVEVMGEWGVKKVISPFAHQYDEHKHRVPCEYIPRIPLRISFDFNLDPFAFVYYQFWQDNEGYHLHYFEEETIPAGSLDEACDRILSKYRNVMHLAIITGDYSGNARNMTAPDKASNYEYIRRKLGLRKTQLDIKPNPTHRNSRDDCNYVLRHFPDFRVSPQLRELERDLRTVEVNPDGSIIKTNRKIGNQRADHLDAFRYSVNSQDVQRWIKSHQK